MFSVGLYNYYSEAVRLTCKCHVDGTADEVSEQFGLFAFIADVPRRNSLERRRTSVAALPLSLHALSTQLQQLTRFPHPGHLLLQQQAQPKHTSRDYCLRQSTPVQRAYVVAVRRRITPCSACTGAAFVLSDGQRSKRTALDAAALSIVWFKLVRLSTYHSRMNVRIAVIVGD